MKARFLALAALVLGLASCQTEPEGLGVNVGGEVDTYVTVSLPETTRANSALGAFDNVDLNGTNGTDYTVRYIFEVYYGEIGTQKQVLYSDSKSVSFPVRLVPGRDYNFVAWADIVAQPTDDKMNKALPYEDTDVYYETSVLKNITVIDSDSNNEWNAMNEARDAYSGFHNTTGGEKYTGSSSINIRMTRPFAKLRVITTDMVELNNLNITPVSAKVTYSAFSHESFNALDGTYSDATVETIHTFNYADVTSYTDQSGANKVLFTDYFFADASDVVKFELDVYEGDVNNQNATTLIKHNDFKTDIPAQRNYLTTIKGNILTEGNNITVEVNDVFENAGSSNPNYEYATISSEAEFFAAVNGNGGQYILISDIDVDGVYASTNAATRTSTNKTVNINLNGKTITVNNDGTDALISLADGAALIFSGEGDIIGSGKLAEEGANVVVTDAVAVDSDVTGVKTGIDALKYILANGGEFNFTEDLEASEVLLASATNPVVINGNGFTLSTSANRIVLITNSNAVVTFNDVNFISSAVMTYPSDVRGVAVDRALSNVALTLNNCSIDFTDKTTNDWTYAVNVASNGTGHKVTINGGTYEGANVVNVHGAKNTIVVKNATLTSLYPNSDLYYGACIWVLQNMESSVYAEGNTFNGSNAMAFNLGTGTALEEKNNIDNTKFLYKGTYYVASAQRLQEAVDLTKSDIKIEFIGDLNGDVTIIQKQGVKITIDGADHKFNGYFRVHSNSNHYADAALTIKNVNFETSTASVNFINALENGAERYSTNITVEECTFTATGAAVNTAVGASVKATRNFVMNGCEGKNLHSLLQANSCDVGCPLVITNCKAIDCKGGISFTQVLSSVVENVEIDALGYGIRYDGRVDNYGITVKNCDITAAQPFIVRKMTGANNTIALEGANTLTTEAKYQVVITNGSDDEAYVNPTGTYTLTGADSFEVFPEESINGYCDRVITNVAGVTYEGDFFENKIANALWFNNYSFGGDAAIKVVDKTYGAIIMENCSGDFKNDVFTIDNDNNSVMVLQNLNFTLAEGKKLIKSPKKIHQVFMSNIFINGEKMTQETIGKYLENVEWYQVVEEI